MISRRNAVLHDTSPTPPGTTRPASSMHRTASPVASSEDGGKSLRRGWEQRSTAMRSAPVGGGGSGGGGGGGGGSTRGVLVGLSLLIMGDVARGYVSPSNNPKTLLPSSSGFQQGGFCRLQEDSARRKKSTDYDCCGNVPFVDYKAAMGLSAVSGGGVFLDGRTGMRRRRRGGTIVSALSHDTQKQQRQHQQQQQQDYPLPSQSTERVRAVTGTAATAGSTKASPLPRAGAAAREEKASATTAARAKPTAGGVEGARRVDTAAARRSVSATDTAPVGFGAAGAESGGGKRLGVIRRAEGGGAARTKAKVKALYFRARDVLKRSPPASLEAIDLLEEALDLDARDGHSWLLLAKTWEQRGRVDASRDVFKRATTACPDNVYLWQSWGMLEDKFGDLSMARRLFANGLEADPGNPFVCHAWGLMEQRDADIDRAREIFKSSRPKAAIASVLGELEATRGDLEGARREFEEGLARLERAGTRKTDDWEGAEDPSEILVAWARLEEQLGGDLDRAMQLLEKAKESDPDNVKTHIERARFEMRRGNMTSARLILSRAADLPQKAGNLFNMWATLETKEGNFDTALKIAQAATERFPQDKSLLQTLGTIHGKLGQHAEAIDCYRRSVAVRPAAPAYVAWALVVAKLADRAARKQSSRSVEEASEKEDDGDNGFRLGGNGVLTSGTAGTRACAGLLANGDGEDDIINGDAFQYSPESNIPVETPALVDLGPCSTHSASRILEVSGRVSVSSSTSVSSLTSSRKGGEASYEEARRIFELGIMADPAHGPLYNAYGTMEARIGNVDHARDVYKRGIAARCCGMASVWQGLGALEASVGNRDRGREIFARGIRDSSDDVSFLFHSLGSLELNAFRLEDARTVFIEGIGRYPKNTQLLLGAALTEAKMANTDEARDLFRRAVQADPSHAHAWQAWGLMESRLGNHEVARSLWESGLKACPLHGPLWQAYAVMEEGLGEQERSRKLFEAGLERCPEHVQLHQASAVMEAKAGDLSLARQLVLDGLRVDPYHGALWTVYAVIERQLGSEGKARKVMELGASACPKHGPLFRSWGQMEFQSGNIAESRRVFERGLKACPTNVRLYYAYGDVEASLGNLDSLEELTLRGKEALLSRGVSPRELQEFDAQMQAYATLARFDASSTWEDRQTAGDVFDVD